MTRFRDSKTGCKKAMVSICQIEQFIIEKQKAHLDNTGTYLSIQRAIIQLITEAYGNKEGGSI